MLGRIIGLIVAAAMGVLAALLYDPMLLGAGAPAVSLGELEVFRLPLTLATALLALCGLLAAVQPPRRTRKAAPFARAAEPDVGMEARPTTTETRFESEPDVFRLGSAPSASPLW